MGKRVLAVAKAKLCIWLGSDSKAPMATEKCDFPISVSFYTIEILFCVILKRICAIHKKSILVCYAVKFLQRCLHCSGCLLVFFYSKGPPGT